MLFCFVITSHCWYMQHWSILSYTFLCPDMLAIRNNQSLLYAWHCNILLSLQESSFSYWYGRLVICLPKTVLLQLTAVPCLLHGRFACTNGHNCRFGILFNCHGREATITSTFLFYLSNIVTNHLFYASIWTFCWSGCF
jgi:hypothetical protein